MLRTCLAAAIAILCAADAHAAVLFNCSYQANAGTPSAAGTTPGHLPLANVGGMANQSGAPSGCPAVTGTSSTAGGTLSFSIPGSQAASFILDLNLQDIGLIGDIYELVLDGSSLGTTSITGLNDTTNGNSAGIFIAPGTVNGGATFTVGITDLLQQYIGHPDTLPGLLGDPSLNSPTLVPSGFGLAGFLLEADVTPVTVPVPEPASLAILASGLMFLGRQVHQRRTRRPLPRLARGDQKVN